MPFFHLDGPSIFAGIQKNAVLKEASEFSERQIREHKCIDVMTKILHLLIQGEPFSEDEIVSLFFGCTKLFLSQSPFLHRMLYLMLKELIVSPEKSLIAINCLLNDLSSGNEMYKSNSIRVLGQIIDPSMVDNIERQFKQNVVDKDPFVVTSTLVACQRLLRTNFSLLKRWTEQFQHAYLHGSAVAQFHALSLMYQLKAGDKVGLLRSILQNCSTSAPSHLLSKFHQVRVVARVIRRDPNPNNVLMQYLLTSLRDSNYAVAYEAARGLCAMEHHPPWAAVETLRDLLRSTVPTLRFAAVRTLADVVVRYPTLVSPCMGELEALVTDGNRSVATLAVTTLLKTSAEGSVDRLIKSLSGFMVDVNEDFKVVLVEAVQDLGLKFPHKYHTLLSFLNGVLRDEGGYRFKKAVVNSMLALQQSIPAAHELGLDFLAEFIEDCEFAELSVRILNRLGEMGPSVTNPGKYIRHVYNRTILEVAPVRAAATHALARFGASIPSLTSSVVALLQSVLLDNDDEVRDRAAFYLSLFNSGTQHLINLTEYVEQTITRPGKPLTTKQIHPNNATNNASTTEQVEHKDSSSSTPSSASSSASSSFTPSSPSSASPLGPDPPLATPRDIEYSVMHYLNSGAYNQTPFTLSSHFVAAPVERKVEVSTSLPTAGSPTASSSPIANGSALPTFTLPEGAPDLGSLWCSSEFTQLTEAETEYLVSVRKHVYQQHVVLEFSIQNNIANTTLVTATVDVEFPHTWQPIFSTSAQDIAYGAQGTAYIAYQRPTDSFSADSTGCRLVFTLRTEDGGEDEDDYQLENVRVTEANFIRKPSQGMGMIEFKRQWEALGEKKEAVRMFTLTSRSLQEVVGVVVDRMGLIPCEGSAIVPEGMTTYGVALHGEFLGGEQVLCRAGFKLDTKGAQTIVGFKIGVRGNNAQVVQIMSQAIRS